MPQKLNTYDYIGKKYNKLTIIGVFEEHKYPSKTKMLCRCDCGKECSPILSVLIHDRVVSCGCYAKETAASINYIDETGNKYNNIIVIERHGSTRKGLALWKCLCLGCNTDVILSGRDLRNCNLQFCKKCTNTLKDRNRRSVKIGDKFGKLTVVEVCDGNSPGNMYKTYACRCICECGKTTVVKGCRLTNGTTRSCGCLRNSYEMRKRNSALRQEIPIEKWDGFAYNNGLIEFRFSPEYQQWRNFVFERDAFTCMKCGSKFDTHFNNLQAHHLDSYTDFPEKRLDVFNGVTLCNVCHASKYLGSFHNSYGTRHNTRSQFEEWIQIKR